MQKLIGTLPDLLNVEMLNALRKACDDAMDDAIKKPKNSMDREGYRYFIGGNLRNLAVREFLKSTTTCLREYLAAPQLFHEQFVIKYQGDAGIFDWHQDGAYEVDPTPYYTLWLALDDTEKKNGGLEVAQAIPKGIQHHKVDANGDLTFNYKGPSKTLLLDAGSAIIFHSRVPHRSGPNFLSKPRRAYVSFWHSGEL